MLVSCTAFHFSFFFFGGGGGGCWVTLFKFCTHNEQSGRSVNLRTPSCHGKEARCGDAIVRVVSRSISISAENLPKWTSRRSSRAESRVTIDRLLSCFFLVEMEPASQMNSANPTAEISSCDLRDEMARRMRRSLKTGGSIQALRVSDEQDVEEESMVIERRWKWPSFYALIVLS